MRKSTYLLILLFLTSSTLTIRASKAVTEVVSTLTTGEVIHQVEGTLNGLMTRAEQSADFVLKRSAQELLFTLHAFEKVSEDTLEKAFAEISDERKSVLNQLIETTNQLDKTVGLTLEQAEAMLDQVDRLTRDVTFKSYPIVFRYRGSIVAPGNTQNIRLAVYGANLANSSPTFTFQQKTYPVNALGENLLIEIPRAIFTPKTQNIVSQYAELTFVRTYGGFLGFFQNKDIVTYKLNLVTLPHKLGDIVVEYKQRKDIEETFTRQFEVNHNSSARSLNKGCKPFSYLPSKTGRTFDPTTSTVKPADGNSRGKLMDVSIRDVGVSFNICAYRNIYDKDNGYRHVKVKLIEVENKTSWVDKTKNSTLNWTQDVLIRIDNGSKNISVEINLFSGQSIALTKSGKASQYVNVVFDEDKNIVVVKPVIPNDILKL